MSTAATNLTIGPGQKVTLQPVSWQRFEAILDELGEKRSSLGAYANGILEIMAPLPRLYIMVINLYQLNFNKFQITTCIKL